MSWQAGRAGQGSAGRGGAAQRRAGQGSRVRWGGRQCRAPLCCKDASPDRLQLAATASVAGDPSLALTNPPLSSSCPSCPSCPLFLLSPRQILPRAALLRRRLRGSEAGVLRGLLWPPAAGRVQPQRAVHAVPHGAGRHRQVMRCWVMRCLQQVCVCACQGTAAAPVCTQPALPLLCP